MSDNTGNYSISRLSPQPSCLPLVPISCVALHLAITGGHTTVVSLLLSLGAHFSEEEKRKISAVDV